MGTDRFQRGAGRVALCGILAALALVFLYIAAIAPTGQIGLAAVAGLFPMAAVISAGLKAGLFTWAAAGLLALLLLPGKGSALLFLLFLGIYPVIKSLIERRKNLALEWVCKLGFFNLDLLICVMALKDLLLSALPSQLQSFWALWLCGNIVFVIYDIGLSKLASLYWLRVNKRLRK